jgi:serine protease Do
VLNRIFFIGFSKKMYVRQYFQGDKTMYVRSKSDFSRLFLIIIAVFGILFCGSGAVFAESSQAIDTARQLGEAFNSIAEKSSSAVVGIEVEKVVSRNSGRGNSYGPSNDDLYEFFFGRPNRRSTPQQRTQPAQGSGFVISADGYILTNNHLAGETSKITVKLNDGREMVAKVVGTDPESDVAVIKVEAEDLAYLELADSDEVKVGQWVIAVGNPFGLNHTVTAGIVSAVGRSIGLNQYEDFIQTDAAINPGNSGGPLLNIDGEVIGINTAIISQSGGNMGIGLAIPVNMAKSIYEQLIDNGTVSRGFLGVTIQDLDPKLAELMGMENTRGVLFPEVTADSPADKAGLKKDDVLVEFEGEAIENKDVFRNRVARLKPGTKVDLVVIRDGERKKVTVELGERPKGHAGAGADPRIEELGIVVQELSDELAKRFGYEGLSGVIVAEVENGSLAAKNGINPGALIMEVDRQAVRTVGEFRSVINKALDDNGVLLLVKDRFHTHYVAIRW